MSVKPLIVHAIILAAINLAALAAGEFWQRCTAYSHPAAALLPLHLLVSLAGFAVWDRISKPLFRIPAVTSLRARLSFIAVLVAVAAVPLFATLVMLGSRLSIGRLILVIGWQFTATWVCLIACHRYKTWPQTRFEKALAVRTLAVAAGLGLCTAIVVSAEITSAWILSARPPGPQKVYEGEYLESGAFYRHDNDLGTALRENRNVACHLRVDGETVWDVRYSTDQYGRRTTTHPEGIPAQFTAMFFGCSFLFGEGANDDQTIPSQFSLLRPEYRSVNYGVPGYGTQHMLALLESGRLPSEVSEPVKLGIYLYLPEIHEARVVGDMDIVNSFGADFPYYHLVEDNTVARRSSFGIGRKWTTLGYNVMGKSSTLRLLGIRFPQRKAAHYHLTAAIIRRSQELFERQFPTARFLVVAYPANPKAPTAAGFCSEFGIAVCNLTGAFDPSEQQFHHSGDGHPTPLANRLVAENIAAAAEVAQ